MVLNSDRNFRHFEYTRGRIHVCMKMNEVFVITVLSNRLKTIIIKFND